MADRDLGPDRSLLPDRFLLPTGEGGSQGGRTPLPRQSRSMTAKGFTAELETSLRSIHAPKAAKLDAGAAISRASISSSPSCSVHSRTSRWSDRMYEIPLSRASRHAGPRSQASVHAMARFEIALERGVHDALAELCKHGPVHEVDRAHVWTHSPPPGGSP
jgi:hypothetical protein